MYSSQPFWQCQYHTQASAFSYQPELIANGRTNEVDQYKMKIKQKPNTANKANIGSTKFPLPIVAQLY
jgi:hypothetical protein